MNEKIEVPTMQVPPLKKICMTIGQLPTSYLETMSYYEMLVWFVNYLRDNIIPVVNANGLATKELQELYVELQNYVNNYFDNLDVQDEIDNKLEEMADSGQLTDIIAQYLGLAGMITFNSVAEMKLAQNLVNGSKCATLGYYSANDGGNAFYKVRTVTNEDTEDDMYIIALYDNTLVAELIIENDTINIKQFGAKGDGTTNNTTIIQNAINLTPNNVYIPKGNYLINSSLLIDKPLHLYGDGVNGVSELLGSGNTNILYSGTGTAVNATIANQHFGRLLIENITIKSINETHTGCGLLVHNFNHFLFKNVTVCNFENGTGFQVGNNASFGCQYGTIENCISGMNLIGIKVYRSNGINIIDSYIDGNNNGSSIPDYTHGYPDNSIGIHFVSGDTCKSIGNRIQGFETGIKVDTSLCVISSTRCEMCYKGYVITGTNNTIEDGCTNSNYLLLEKNGIALTGRYGYVADITGNRNVIGKLQYGSCIGPTNSGTNNEIGERIVIYIPEISDTLNLKGQLSAYLKAHSSRINYFAIKCSNMAEVKAGGYANRWTIATQSAYIETNNIDDSLLTSFIPVAQDKYDAISEIPINFTKSGSAVTLKNVEILIDMLQW